jgi:hypothetical protein
LCGFGREFDWPKRINVAIGLSKYDRHSGIASYYQHWILDDRVVKDDENFFDLIPNDEVVEVLIVLCPFKAQRLSLIGCSS